MRRLTALALSLLLAAPPRALAGSKVETGVGRVGAPQAPGVGLPAVDLKLVSLTPGVSLTPAAGAIAPQPLNGVLPSANPQLSAAAAPAAVEARAPQAQAPAQASLLQAASVQAAGGEGASQASEPDIRSGRITYDGAGRQKTDDAAVSAVFGGASASGLRRGKDRTGLPRDESATVVAPSAYLPPSNGSSRAFIPESSLTYRKFHWSRALEHSFGGGWVGDKLFEVPLTVLDHLVLFIAGTPLYFAFPNNHHHLVEYFDEKRVADNAKRWRADPGKAKWDSDLMRQVDKFEAATGWSVAWTDSPGFLAIADDANKRMVLSLGWVLKSEVRKDRRRSVFLASILARARDSIAIREFNASSGWTLDFAVIEPGHTVYVDAKEKKLSLGGAWIEKSHTAKARAGGVDLSEFLARFRAHAAHFEAQPGGLAKAPANWWHKDVSIEAPEQSRVSAPRPPPAPSASSAAEAAAVLERSLAGHPKAQGYAARALSVGSRRGFDVLPVVTHMVERIGRGKSIDFKEGPYVSGRAELSKTGLLDVTIFEINHDPKQVDAWAGSRVGKAHAPAGVSAAYSQILYGALKGVALKAARDPSVKSARITAWRVMNEDLRKAYAELGFTRSRPDLPEDFPQAWTLEFPIAR